MSEVLRIVSMLGLRSDDPTEAASNWQDATHQRLLFSECVVEEGDVWLPRRSWLSIVSVDRLFALLKDAGLLRELRWIPLSELEGIANPNDSEQPRGGRDEALP